MTKIEVESITFESEIMSEGSSINIDERGWLHFEAVAMNDKVLPEEWHDYVGKDSVGKHFLYRHRHPQNPEHKDEPYYGRVESYRLGEVKDEEGNIKKAIINGFCVKNTLERQVKLQELIIRRQREKRPMGVSYQFDLYKQGGKIIDIDVVEISSTHIPAIRDARVFEDNEPTEEHQMPGNKSDDDIAETDGIQAQLDEKSIEQLEGLEKELEEKKGDLERLNREYEDYKQNSEQRVATQRSAFQKMTEMLEDVTKRLEKVEKDKIFLETVQPILNEIDKFEHDPMLQEVYKKQSVEWLQKRLEYVKKLPKAQLKIQTAHDTSAYEGHEDSADAEAQEKADQKWKEAFNLEELKAMGFEE